MSTGARIAIVTLAGLITVVLVVVFASRFGADPTLSPSPLIGTAAPEIELDLVESDDTLSLSDLRGEIVVLNFWAPWCVPCRAEHGELVSIAEGFDEFGVTVIGAAYQSREPNVIAFLDELGRGYPVGMDERSRAAIGFGVRGVPETYFVNREGTVVAKVAGPIDAALASATLDRIILGEAVDSVRTGEVQTNP